ncbi:carbon storage regulator CsrA [Paenibacillus turpanensis]|uniref:carbon storage regulator CsrA n=1 Tax=Paenibacillus turpanensis TaxID=2689078 RepID=UPI00140B5258|nr:carbon storage regulator CsrA [Paenibacillus turpanensis]
MLVLSRKKGQTIVIQDNIEITVLEVDGETVKIGISAPKEVQIVRKELLSSIKETNQEAAGIQVNIGQLANQLKLMKKKL